MWKKQTLEHYKIPHECLAQLISLHLCICFKEHYESLENEWTRVRYPQNHISNFYNVSKPMRHKNHHLPFPDLVKKFKDITFSDRVQPGVGSSNILSLTSLCFTCIIVRDLYKMKKNAKSEIIYSPNNTYATIRCPSNFSIPRHTQTLPENPTRIQNGILPSR